jgi:hypothetical protein
VKRKEISFDQINYKIYFNNRSISRSLDAVNDK